MNLSSQMPLKDTGERMIPTGEGEISYVFARHKFAYAYARQYARSRRVLDLGCGTGYGCRILSDVAQSVVGIDHDPEAIEYCSRNFPASNVSYIRSDISDVRFRNEFDLGVSFQVIEHMRDLELFLLKLTTAVVSGGTIIITTPNVRIPTPERDANPFHANEMNAAQFHRLLSDHFSSFELSGIGYASPSILRTIVQNSPLYRIGKFLTRKSVVKRIASASLGLTDFRVLRSDVESNSIDLLAICKNERPSAT